MNSKGNVAWSVFDADYPTYVEQQFGDGAAAMLEAIPAELEERIEWGDVFMADTLEELAEK